MITREEIIKTVQAVISELFPFLLRSGANTHIILLPETPLSTGEQLEYVKRHFGGDFITYAGYGESERYYGDVAFKLDYDLKNEKKSLCARAADFKSVTLVSPSAKILRDLAEGNEESAEVSLAIYALLHKRKVRVLTDFDPSDIVPGAFAKNISDLYGRVVDMGIEVVRATTLEEENYDAMAGFVNEETVRLAAKERKREIVINEKTIVTPLARDAAEELGIRIRVKL